MNKIRLATTLVSGSVVACALMFSSVSSANPYLGWNSSFSGKKIERTANRAGSPIKPMQEANKWVCTGNKIKFDRNGNPRKVKGGTCTISAE